MACQDRLIWTPLAAYVPKTFFLLITHTNFHLYYGTDSDISWSRWQMVCNTDALTLGQLDEKQELRWAGQYTPVGFLEWEETLHYLHLVTQISIMYLDR